MPAKAKVLIVAALAAAAFAVNMVARAPASNLKASGAEPTFTRVKSKTGVELQVAQRGPQDGEPVLFLLGYGDSWFSYSPVLERLPSNIRAIFAITVAPGERLSIRKPRPASTAVTVYSAGGIFGCTMRIRLSTANDRELSSRRSTRVTVFVHSGHRSTSVNTA